ncbi:hypothetical protein [Streptomyces jumonjinensis]|uniref:Uncharacterized protein n=1 Tax=Streptomyces jumonjinensis TaxID=1945 RepID=A0A646K9Z7_STRJU|nr:hypothetical protein [Streptomyces jumonjinensis]MQS99038.1 hypothetical protein [Streptomyces jumonjinensis]
MQPASEIDWSQELDPGRVYGWSVVVAVQTVAQEHWGEYRPEPGTTAGQALEEIRRLCADRMSAPESVVRLVTVRMAPQ